MGYASESFAEQWHSTQEQQDGLAVMLRVVFSRLASAVPSLQHLKLDGQCWDAALQAFGANCPRLVGLTVEAEQVPITALLGFSTHLPNLGSLTICGHGMSEERDFGIKPFLDTALAETRGCAKLTSLILDLPSITLRCRKSSWSRLPASLMRFHCPCIVWDSHEFERLVRRVPRLLLYQCPFSSMLEFHKHFPVLEEFDIPEDGDSEGAVELWCSDFKDERRVIALQQRLLAKPLRLHCAMAVHGTCEEVQALLEWLPAFPDVWSVTINFQEKEQVQCLQQLACTFPGARYVTLTGELGFPADPDSDDDEEPEVGANVELDFYAPLTEFPSLTHRDLSVDGMTLTTDDMLQLCTDMEALSTLTLGRSCTGVEKQALAAELRGQGRKIEVS